MSKNQRADLAGWKPRRWRGHWFHCCGEFSPEDAAGCCLGFTNPCGVAYGWNVSKVLHLSFWKEALKYIILILLLRTVNAFIQYGKLFACLVSRLSVESADAEGNMLFRLAGGPPSASCSTLESLGGLVEVAMLVCVLCWALFVGGKRRRQMREELGIPLTSEGKCCSCCHNSGDHCNDDCCLHFWCMPCALAQETRTILHEEAGGSLAPRLVGHGYSRLTNCGEELLLAPHEVKDMQRGAAALPV